MRKIIAALALVLTLVAVPAAAFAVLLGVFYFYTWLLA